MESAGNSSHSSRRACEAQEDAPGAQRVPQAACAACARASCAHAAQNPAWLALAKLLLISPCERGHTNVWQMLLLMLVLASPRASVTRTRGARALPIPAHPREEQGLA